MDGLLRAAWEERGADLPQLRHQPPTFYRCRRRYRTKRLASLEERSRRPGLMRQPTWSPELAQAVQELREQYARWGKDKLATAA